MGRVIKSVLIADDDELILSSFRGFFPRRGIRAYTASDRPTALELAREHQPEVAYVDLRLGADSGLEVSRELTTIVPSMRVFLITGYGSIRATVQAMRCGVFDVLTKPFTLNEAMRRAIGDTEKTDITWQSAETPSADRVLWEHVQRVLNDCNGNKSETCRRLKKPRSWLRRLLAKPPPAI